MECYISQDYFPRLEELLIPAKDDILSGKATNLNVIFQLLSALTLNTDIDALEIKKYAKSLVGNKIYTSFKDRIISNAIKNQKLKNCDLENWQTTINNLSAFYFLNDENAVDFSKMNGVVCKGIDYKGESFYDDCTVADLPINNTWNPIIGSVPPVNAMLIVDPYIFGHPFEIKLSSLLEFIKMYKQNLEIPFHLSILFSSENKNSKWPTTPNQIKKAFDELSNISNVEIRIYSDPKIPIADRLIFTNYTSGNIGHPFDGRDTRFTQNFLGRENNAPKIQRNYRNYREDILFWNNFLAKIPAIMGTVQMIWESSKFNNRLFQPFLECNKF